MILSGDTTRVLWAYHPNDPVDGKVSYHGHQNRGVRSLYLKEGPSLRIPADDLPYLKFWDLRAKNTRLPNDDHTHYWCQIYKAPELAHKHHMIGVSLMEIFYPRDCSWSFKGLLWVTLNRLETGL